MGVILKAVQRGDRATAFHFLITCLPSGLLPIFGLLLGQESYTKTRRLWVAAANIMQFYQVGKYYGQMYPCIGDCPEASISLRKAFTAVLASNGTAFLILTTFLGALTFKWLFITQYIYFLILTVSNRNICGQSPALRRAYNWLHDRALVSTLRRFAKNLWPVQLHLSTRSRAMSLVDKSIDVCVSSQVVFQLVLGLWVPSFLAYRREVHSRRLFLSARLGEEASRKAIFPSPWEIFMYAMPALTFPWMLLVLFGANFEAAQLV